MVYEMREFNVNNFYGTRSGWLDVEKYYLLMVFKVDEDVKVYKKGRWKDGVMLSKVGFLEV